MNVVVMQFFNTHNTIQPLFNGGRSSAGNVNAPTTGGAKTVGRWLKDRKERKKEETRAHNAQIHAAVSVAAVAAAVAAIAAATAASSASGKNEQAVKTDTAVASAAALVAAQCAEAAESLGADHDHLTSVVSSAVNVRSCDDIVTLTAAAATGTHFRLSSPLFNYLLHVLKMLSNALFYDMWYYFRVQLYVERQHLSQGR